MITGGVGEMAKPRLRKEDEGVDGCSDSELMSRGSRFKTLMVKETGGCRVQDAICVILGAFWAFSTDCVEQMDKESRHEFYTDLQILFSRIEDEIAREIAFLEGNGPSS